MGQTTSSLVLDNIKKGGYCPTQCYDRLGNCITCTSCPSGTCLNEYGGCGPCVLQSENGCPSSK